MATQTSGTRGRVAFHLFTAMALELGWEAFIPLNEESPVDLLVFVDGTYHRVQIKRVYQKDGHRTINLKRRNGDRYKGTEIDDVVAVDVATGTIWLLPFKDLHQPGALETRGRLRLTAAWDKYRLVGL